MRQHGSKLNLRFLVIYVANMSALPLWQPRPRLRNMLRPISTFFTSSNQCQPSHWLALVLALAVVHHGIVQFSCHQIKVRVNYRKKVMTKIDSLCLNANPSPSRPFVEKYVDKLRFQSGLMMKD